MTIKVLVVDDAVVIRKILTDVINADPELEVIGTAASGIAGLEAIERLQPDIVTLDVEMLGMDRTNHSGSVVPRGDGLCDKAGQRWKRPRGLPPGEHRVAPQTQDLRRGRQSASAGVIE